MKLLRSIYQKNDEAERKAPEKHWYLSNLVVTKKAQGNGVGSMLLEWGFKKADKAGFAVFCLSSAEVGKFRTP